MRQNVPPKLLAVGWLSGTYADDEEPPQLGCALVRDFAVVAREAEAMAASYERRARDEFEYLLGDGLTEVSTVEAMRRWDAANAGMKMAAGMRSVARVWWRLAGRWKHRPWVTASVADDRAMIEAVSAPSVATMLSWVDGVAELVERVVERLPFAHGPPPRALTEVHAPNVGVPAPPAAVAAGERSSCST